MAISIETDRALTAMTLLLATIADDRQTVADIPKNRADDELVDGLLTVAEHLDEWSSDPLVETLRAGPGAVAESDDH
ncbi:hypothetical protein [Streptomyces violaceus]|uniref:Uncharacterized protein n=1 Tax=Streptomyces violaceus TaxID=1936 RepID=A0ABY9U3Z9_STRVL|nr:hypothetical protein [Streptomyces janthinus]WND17548.1 hypothetical protein RI060_09415 [Streptomyces janthinus]GGS37120.1 hypothetical protein GCM10010270_02850 [Streptomyces janthinus]